jgi:Zn-dependent protease with chaperone function
MKNIVLYASCTLVAVAGIFAVLRLERRAFEREIDESKKEISSLVAQEIVKETIGMAAQELGLPPPSPPSGHRTNTTAIGTIADVILDSIPRVGDLVKQGAEIRKEVVDQVVELTPEEQIDIGETFHKVKMENGEKLDDEELHKRLQTTVDRFAVYSKLPYIKYVVTVMKDEEFNAGATVGGYIYVNTGLLDRNPTDAALAFILGHEVAHVEYGHSASRIKQQFLASRIGETLGGDIGLSIAEFVEDNFQSLIAISYSQDQEFACDEWSFHHMRKMGYSRDEALAGIRLLYEVAIGEGDVRSTTSSKTARVIGEALNRHFRSHPFSEDRVARLEALP